MKYIHLVRHGEKHTESGDPELTEFGIHQALLTAQFFRQFPIEAIYASPLARTQQTATIIARAVEAEVYLHPGLRERVNWGDHPNQSFTQFIQEWEKATVNRDYQPPGGDSSRAAGERLHQAIQTVDQSSGHIILVSHAGIIKDYLLNEFETSRETYHAIKEMRIAECSVTTLEISPSSINILRLASTYHLENTPKTVEQQPAV